MHTNENHEQIRRTLLDCGHKFNTTNLFPTVVPEASSIVVNDPYAFGIATCLDRGTKADIIWTIPFDIKKSTRAS